MPRKSPINQIHNSVKKLEIPPWAKNTDRHKDKHGPYADFVAWEDWIGCLDNNDILSDFGSTEKADLYAMFTLCFPNYSWS